MTSKMKTLFYYWRLAATAMSYTLFGLGALFLTLFLFPLQVLIIQNEEKKKKAIRSTISASFRLFLKFMELTGVFKFKLAGKELIKEDKGCILIANHPTLIDVVVIIAHYPNACCIVKKELWNNFFLKGVVSAAQYIPNDDPEIFLINSKRAIDQGDALIIFPEGTRTTPGKEIYFKRGAAHVALSLNASVRCIKINCSPLTLSKQSSWYDIPPSRAHFSIEIRSKISPTNFDIKIPRSLLSRQLTRDFLKTYQEESSC